MWKLVFGCWGNLRVMFRDEFGEFENKIRAWGSSHGESHRKNMILHRIGKMHDRAFKTHGSYISCCQFFSLMRCKTHGRAL